MVHVRWILPELLIFLLNLLKSKSFEHSLLYPEQSELCMSLYLIQIVWQQPQSTLKNKDRFKQDFFQISYNSACHHYEQLTNQCLSKHLGKVKCKDSILKVLKEILCSAKNAISSTSWLYILPLIEAAGWCPSFHSCICLIENWGYSICCVRWSRST